MDIQNVIRFALSEWHESRKYATPLVLAGIACLALIVFSRSPDLLLTARFFAEDGQVFYQQAHELGILHSIFVPYAGYLHLFPRLIAGLSLLVPFFFAPLLFNVAALAIHCLTAAYIASPRMRNIGPVPVRIFVALLYLGLPHIGEVWGKVTNSQWQMAVLSFLILIAVPPQSRLGTWFDGVALAVGALTGPFGILLLPIALVVVVWRRSRGTITHLAILAVGAAVQAISLLTQGRPEDNAKLGATFPLLCKLLLHWLLLGVLPGRFKARFLQFSGLSWVLGGCLLVVALAVIAWILWKGSLEMRCTLLFGAMVTAASLASPIIVTRGEQWPVMLTGAGERYWFVPRMVLAVAVLWVAVQSFSKWARVAGIAAMVAIVAGCAAGWHIAQWKGIHFRTYAHVFDALPVGAQLRMPIDPPPSWTLKLTKELRDRTSHDPGFTDGKIMAVDDWRNRLQAASLDESSTLTGGVLEVNGTSLGAGGSQTAPAHVPVRDGALLEGWVLLVRGAELTPIDEVYAIVSGRVVRGDRIPLVVSYQEQHLENAAYLVFLPSMVLHRGLQEVTIVGYARSDNRLRSCVRKLYTYGD